MADQQSDSTIRQMLSGFSAMQYNLGLLPMPQAQAMAGAAAPYQAPPPPPPVPHPSQAALTAMQNHNNMIQQTLAAAQVTRYQPPPSAPMPSVSAMSGFGAFNPFGPQPAGGGVGFAGGGGGGFGGAAFAPRLPSIFNPFAPTLPAPHFATPAQRNYQLMQHAQAQTMGLMAGIGEGVMGIGGAAAGGALGSMLGPIGSIGGAWLGSKVGGALSGMIFNPVTSDYRRGAQIQQMTSPFMVSGAHMNMFTGQGMDPRAARDVASGIRHLQRDHDFERTGFNTQDTMRVMQMSAGAGLLVGAQSPDQMVQKVKEISKTVKVLMRITGDPDVRDAIHALGQMRDLGFQGIAAQAGAVANRAQFARMAGMSTGQMGQVMAGGADMAGQFGLAGATGATAAMQGAASANLAASSGALGDLQLARAGGRAGLGGINTAGQLAAVQNDQYLLAAMGRGPGGRMQVDMDAFRRTQGLSFDEVQRRAADSLRSMDAKGIFEWNTRRQEFKDQVAQKLRPGEMQMMLLQQARSFQGQFAPGQMSLGTAIQSVSQGALTADQSRALELQFQNRGYWDAQIQQLRVQRRDAADQERARREQYRTPGLMTRARRGMGDLLGGASDVMSSPFRAASRHFERVREDEDAASRGERIGRYDDLDIAHDEAERGMLGAGLRDRGFRGAMGRGGGSFLDGGGSLGHHVGRQINRIGSFLGLSSLSDENRLVGVASRSRGSAFGLHPLASFGDAGDALARVQDVSAAARGADAGVLGGDAMGSLIRRIGDSAARGKSVNGMAVLNETTRNVVSILKEKKAGLFTSATAMGGSDVQVAYMRAARQSGMSVTEAQRSWEQDKGKIIASVSQDVYATGDKSLIEPWEKAKDTMTEAGGVSLTRSRDSAASEISRNLKAAGIDGVSEDTLGKMKSVVAHHDESTIALATAIAARSSSNKAEREGAQRVLADFEKNVAPEKQGAMMKDARVLATSMDNKTKDAFELMLRGTVGKQGMEMTVGVAKKALSEKMALSAQNKFLEHLDGIHTGAGAAGSVQQAIAMMDPSDLDKLETTDPKLAALIRRGQKGDVGAINEAITRAAPTTTTTRHGGGSGGAVDALDRQMSDLEDARDKFSQETGDGADGSATSLQAQSTSLFAGAVQTFADAVKDLKGGTESNQLSWSSPGVIARLLDGR